MGIINIYAFILAVVGIVLLPGPNSLYIFSISSSAPYKKTLGGILGVFLGDAMLMLGSFVGLAGVLHNPTVYGVMKILGAFYLLYVGIKIMRGVIWSVLKKAIPEKLAKIKLIQESKKPVGTKKRRKSPPETTAWAFFLHAFMISLLNPKAIFFFVSFFLQFIDPTYPYPIVPFLIQAAIVQCCSMLYLHGIVYFGQKALPFFERKIYLQRAIFLSIGGLFVTYGVVLLLH